MITRPLRTKPSSRRRWLLEAGLATLLLGTGAGAAQAGPAATTPGSLLAVSIPTTTQCTCRSPCATDGRSLR